METRHLVTLLQAEAPVSLAGVQRFVEALLEEHVTPSTVGEIVLRVHGFLCHAETHLQHAAPQTVAALAATSDDHECVRDALEKLLVSKVYHRVFGVSEGGMERDAALHKRLSGLSHLTYVGRLQPVTRCCYHPIMYPDNSMYPWNPVRSGQRRSESVLRLARRSSKAGARRSSSSADWGSTVRPKTRSGCIHDAHACACGRRGGSALHVCASSWQVMLLVNASRMIERRLNKIARLHARQHAQSRPPGCGRAGHLWLEAPSRLHTAALCAPEQSSPGAFLRRRQRRRFLWIWPYRCSCMPTAPPAT